MLSLWFAACVWRRKLLKCVQTVVFKRKESIMYVIDFLQMYDLALALSRLFSLSPHLRLLKNFPVSPSFLLWLMNRTQKAFKTVISTNIHTDSLISLSLISLRHVIKWDPTWIHYHKLWNKGVITLVNLPETWKKLVWIFSHKSYKVIICF